MASNMFDEIEQGAPPAPQEEQQGVAQQQQQPSNVNMFDDMSTTPEQKQEQAVIEQQKPQPTGNAFMDAVTAFNRPMDRAGEGLMQMVGNVLGLSSLKSAADKVTKIKDAELVKAQMRSPTATSIGQGGGEVVKFMGLGGPMGASKKVIGQGFVQGGKALVSNAASTAALSAAQSGMDAADTEEQRMERMAIGGTVGALIPAGLALGGKVLKTTKDVVESFVPQGSLSKFAQSKFFPEQAAAKTVANRVKTQVSGAEKTTNKEAAELLRQKVPKDTNLTPAQALGGEDLVGKEAKHVVEDTSKAQVTRAHVAQTTETLGRLKTSLKNMTPAGNQTTKEIATDLFKRMDNVKVPPKVLHIISEDEGLLKTMGELNKAGPGSMRHIKDASFKKIQALKEEIDEKLYVDGKALSENKMKKRVLDGYIDSRKTLMKALKPYPEYIEALRLSQQVIVRRGYEEDIAKAMAKTPTGQQGIKEVFNKIFGGENSLERQTNFYKNVLKTGGDPEIAEKVVGKLKKLNDFTLGKQLSKQADDTIGTAVGGRNRAVVQQFLAKHTLEQYQKAVLDLTLSGPKWRKEVLHLLETTQGDNFDTVKTVKLLAKVSKSLEMGRKSISPASVATGAHLAKTLPDKPQKKKKKQGYL